MAYEQEKATFDRDGFVVVRQLLSPAEFRELTDNLDRYISEVVPTLADADAFYQDRSKPETLRQMQHMGQDPFFDAYKDHPRWIELAEALLGEAAVSQGPEWFNKPPATEHITPLHQDNYYFNLKPPSVVTIWLALDKVDEENGCLRYLPGSHKGEVVAHGATETLGFSQGISDYSVEDESREVRVCLEPGDIVAHHGNTYHRAEVNRSSTRHRRAFAMVIKGVSCRRDEEGFARYNESLKAQHEAMGLQA